MQKKISVIVPVYNIEKYLVRCIESIRLQTYKNIEIILVDDGSTDNSGKICDEYKQKDERIVVVHKQNGGLSSARNAGLEKAQGDYIGFVDSDDYISEKMYELLINEIVDCENAIANIMYVRAFDNGEIKSSRVPHTENETITAEKYLEELLLHVGDVSVCTKLFPKSLIQNIRFPEGVDNEDLLFAINLIQVIKEVRFVGEVGYYYYVRQNSLSSKYSKAFIDMTKNSLYMLEFVKNNFPKYKKQAIRFALYQNMAYLLSVPKQEATKNNQTYRKAKRFIRRNFVRVLFNKYLKIKQKIILYGLMVFPKLLASMAQKKDR